MWKIVNDSSQRNCARSRREGKGKARKPEWGSMLEWLPSQTKVCFDSVEHKQKHQQTCKKQKNTETETP